MHILEQKYNVYERKKPEHIVYIVWYRYWALKSVVCSRTRNLKKSKTVLTNQNKAEGRPEHDVEWKGQIVKIKEQKWSKFSKKIAKNVEKCDEKRLALKRATDSKRSTETSFWSAAVMK